jgi:hypothetical protein
MKNCFFLFVACILWAVGANGQTLNGHLLSAEPQIFVMPDHPQHASQTGLAQEQDLRERSGVTYARGERPTWELMAPPPFVPIADLARILRDEHARAKKAVISWND